MTRENKQFNDSEPTDAEKSLADSLLKSMEDEDIERYQELVGLVGEETDHPKEAELENIHQTVESRKEFMKKGIAVVPKGTPNAIFFRTLVEDYPQLGLEIDEDVDEYKGKTGDAHLFVVSDLPSSSRERKAVESMVNEPTLAFMTSNLLARPQEMKLGSKLEKQGRIPKGTTERLLAYWYKTAAQFMEEEEVGSADKYKEALNKMDVAPLSEEEVRDLLKSVIEEELPKHGLLHPNN